MTRKTEKPLVRIVDDDPDQLASLEIMLSAEGWDVACYERASDFFAEDAPSRPGCLILDVRMPEISGLEMQEELNRREYPLPILFLTGHGDVDMAVHTLKKGAKDFLLKPVDAPRLLSAPCRSTRPPGSVSFANSPNASKRSCATSPRGF